MIQLMVGLQRLAATPEPAEVVVTPPDELVTPGTIGFLATFAVAVALVLLVRDMNRRVQRVQVRGDRADRVLRDQEPDVPDGPATGPELGSGPQQGPGPAGGGRVPPDG